MPSRTRRFRGSRTHGRGIKAGRGAGKQGGVGNAGLHKYKFKSMLIYAPDHFGRHGFFRPGSETRPLAVNVGDLPRYVGRLEEAKAISRDGDAIVADLTRVGVGRLLGGGSVPGRWKVYVPHASPRAKEKVELLSSPPSTASSAP